MPNWYLKERTDAVFEKRKATKVFAEFGITNVDPVLSAVWAALPAKAWIAGGCLASLLTKRTKRGDIDIWFAGKTQYVETQTKIRALVKSPALSAYEWRETVVRNACVFSAPGVMPISLNGYLDFTSADAIIDSFDFTVAQLALEGDMLWYGPTTLQDLKDNRLSFHRTQNTVMGRADKYLKKGYVPDDTCWQKMEEVAGTVTDRVRTTKNALQMEMQMREHDQFLETQYTTQAKPKE